MVGRKVGLTSPVVQRQLGVDQPDFGVLFEDMLVASGGEVAQGRLIAPKAEAEIAFVLGALLLVYVIRKVGLQPIFSALGRVGFGFFFVVAINGLRHVLRTIAMSISVPPEHRRFTFMQAFAARLGGEDARAPSKSSKVRSVPSKVAALPV